MSALDKKRQEAISYLGDRYVLHSQYRATPRHSNTIYIWYEHRVLKEVEINAKAAGRM